MTVFIHPLADVKTSAIGLNTRIWQYAVVFVDAQIGEYCNICAHTLIESDVIIGNNVEIGANTCVDRGKFSSTIVGDGCKIDNLVQIAHNSKLGKFCIMAGNSGLAGSVTLGNGVVIGGSASIKDHVTIGDGAIIGAGSGVTGDIPAGKVMLGYPAVEARDALKQWAILKRLVKDSSQ